MIQLSALCLLSKYKIFKRLCGCTHTLTLTHWWSWCRWLILPCIWKKNDLSVWTGWFSSG